MALKFINIEKVGEVNYDDTFQTSLIAKGQIGSHDIAILNRCFHPCTYIRLEESSPFFDKSYDDIPLSCHGGLTFAANNTDLGYDELTEGFWIGWDYGHIFDFTRGSSESRWRDFGEHKWTYEELVQELIYVCGQLDGLEMCPLRSCADVLNAIEEQIAALDELAATLKKGELK